VSSLLRLRWFDSLVRYRIWRSLLPDLLDSSGSEDEPYHVSVSNDSGLRRQSPNTSDPGSPVVPLRLSLLDDLTSPFPRLVDGSIAHGTEDPYQNLTLLLTRKTRNGGITRARCMLPIARIIKKKKKKRRQGE